MDSVLAPELQTAGGGCGHRMWSQRSMSEWPFLKLTVFKIQSHDRPWGIWFVEGHIICPNDSCCTNSLSLKLVNVSSPKQLHSVWGLVYITKILWTLCWKQTITFPVAVQVGCLSCSFLPSVIFYWNAYSSTVYHCKNRTVILNLLKVRPSSSQLLTLLMGKIDRFRVPHDNRFLLVPSQNGSLEPLCDWKLQVWSSILPSGRVKAPHWGD